MKNSIKKPQTALTMKRKVIGKGTKTLFLVAMLFCLLSVPSFALDVPQFLPLSIFSDIGTKILKLVSDALPIFTAGAVLAVAVYGFQFFLGNEGRGQAKKNLAGVVIGLVLILAAKPITDAVISVFLSKTKKLFSAVSK